MQQTHDLYVDSATATYRLVQPTDNVHDGVTGGLIYRVTLSQTAHFTYFLNYLAPGYLAPGAVSTQPSTPLVSGTQSQIAANRAAMDAYRQYERISSAVTIDDDRDWHCHGGSGLPSLWRFGSQGDEENQLQRVPVPTRDHPVHAYADRIVIRQNGRVVAEHPRTYKREATIFDPWHYVPVLVRKPGALRNGAPFKDWVLPGAIERVRRKLAGSDDGDGQMVKVLAAVLEDGLTAVEAACAEALAQGVHSADVILNILARRREPPVDSGAKCNRSMRSGFARLCRAL
jgi:hypothetical protein